jgi:hydrogenase maturation protease
MKPRVLIAGIGNIFHGDDAFGVMVAQRLMNSAPIAGAEVRDFGIRGIDLVFAFLNGWELVILVDAVPRRSEPGTICVIEPDPGHLEDDGAIEQIDGHDLDPWQVLRQAARMGAKFGRVIVVGCEPAVIEERIGLSAEVERAIEPAIETIRFLVAEFVKEAEFAKEECAS